MRVSILAGLISLAIFIGFGMKMLYKTQYTSIHTSNDTNNHTSNDTNIKTAHSQTTIKNLALPAGFVRTVTPKNSFANYLQNLPLKKIGTNVLTYEGYVANTNTSAFAVVDLPIGKKDLLQCADAVMNLRARYLYANDQKDAIAFHFVSGFLCDYTSYAAGNRFVVASNSWAKTAEADNSQATFEKYLELVYMYASTLSLQKELKTVGNSKDIQIGDVFIKGGSPGHCFIVVDRCENANKKVQFAILQGFMPAQDMHLLKNSLGTHWFEAGKDCSMEIPYGELLTDTYHKRFAK
jgi:hypothetical protein